MRVHVSSNAMAFARAIADIGDVTPRGVASALNTIAYTMRVETIRGLDNSFTIRKRGYIVRGLRYTKATPQNLESVAGTLQEGLAIHDSLAGSPQKRAVKGKLVGVPFAARPNKTDVTSRSNWPGALARKSGYFFSGSIGSVGVGLWRRRTKQRYPIELVYSMHGATDIPMRWPFMTSAEKLASKEFLGLVEREFDRAVGLHMASRHVAKTIQVRGAK